MMTAKGVICSVRKSQVVLGGCIGLVALLSGRFSGDRNFQTSKSNSP